MGNEQNLKPFTSDQSHAEAVKNGRKGGIASGVAKREKKRLADTLRGFLETDDTQEQIALALIEEAKTGNKSGSVTKAFEVIRDTIGEKPKDTVALENEFTTIMIGFDDQ